MKGWIFLMVVSSLLVADAVSYEIPPSFFVRENGSQNCIIVVGEKAGASDIIAASRLAATISELSARREVIPVIEEVSVQHEDVGAGTCVVETPSELSTLWYFDDYGTYGDGDGKFDPWETHEEIQLFIEDILDFDPLLGIYRGDGFLDFSTILRIDNVRSPPHLWVEAYAESAWGEYVTDLHYVQTQWFTIVDPYFITENGMPQVKIFDNVYNVISCDTAHLVTGTPHLEYVYVYKDSPFKAGRYTISLKDVDVDHNKVYLEITGAGVRREFWMVLDPEHGFSTTLQKEGSREVIAVDVDNDGVIEYVDKEITGNSELDVWGHSASGMADLVIDGIKLFIGEKLGVYLGVYWVEDIRSWPEKECCDPFVTYPVEYNFQIRPETVVVTASLDSYVDEAFPLTNYGGLSYLSVRSFQNANARSFVRFELPLLPSKAIVEKATLRLTPLTVPGLRTYEVSRVTGAWDESLITWGNQPPAVVTGTQANAMMEWDVTADVLNFYSGTPNFGWRISDQTEGSFVQYEILFGSEESAVNPQLILEYTYDCNYLSEAIPHVLNWINTYYDDLDNNGVPDPIYEIDISLCEPVRTVCNPLFFEGPNYSYFVDFSDTSFGTGVDFRVYQIEKVKTYTREEVRTMSWELVKLDTEITEEDAQYNWILVGGMDVNRWVRRLIDRNIVPDDGSPLDWFMDEAGYKMYSDPFWYGNKILVVAGKTAKDTQEAVEMLIDSMKR